MTSTVVDPHLALFLKLGSGLFWTVAYLLILRRGAKDRTYGMPLAALGANIAWEFIFSFVLPHKAPQLQVNYVWFAFDTAILWQTFRFGRAEQAHPWLRRNFPLVLAGTVLTGFLAVYSLTLEFSDWNGMYAAFGQNLMMSILFVAMLLRRDDVRGQSMWIAIAKMVGTILPSILFHLKFPDHPLMNFLYVSIFLFDLLYCALLHAKLRSMGRNPWKRI
jgi:hypothetical protein